MLVWLFCIAVGSAEKCMSIIDQSPLGELLFQKVHSRETTNIAFTHGFRREIEPRGKGGGSGGEGVSGFIT